MAPDVAANLLAVSSAIAEACRTSGRAPSSVQLLAVSKTFPAAAVRAAHAAGQRAFGENRVQELSAKAADLVDLAGLQWHLIGSLQTNKVREVLRVQGLVLVHSLDRERLADELQKELAKSSRSLPVLLQVNATGEDDKHGVPPAGAAALMQHVLGGCPALQLRGVMAMGPMQGDPVPVFRRVAALWRELEQQAGVPLPVLSLGMSGDLQAAIAAGSTLVRIGTGVFGARA
jgi:PLP dependent protein